MSLEKNHITANTFNIQMCLYLLTTWLIVLIVLIINARIEYHLRQSNVICFTNLHMYQKVAYLSINYQKRFKQVYLECLKKYTSFDTKKAIKFKLFSHDNVHFDLYLYVGALLFDKKV